MLHTYVDHLLTLIGRQLYLRTKLLATYVTGSVKPHMFACFTYVRSLTKITDT